MYSSRNEQVAGRPGSVASIIYRVPDVATGAVCVPVPLMKCAVCDVL